MDKQLLSKSFDVISLQEEHLPCLYELMKENTEYYKYCPPVVSIEGIREDMKKTPPGKTLKDKYYIGFKKQNEIIAVMDLILGYPNEATAFIGFFMMKKSWQNKGIGSLIIEEVLSYLRKEYSFVRLGYVLGNKQSESFWLKQGFKKTGLQSKEPLYTIIVLEKSLGGK